MAKTTLINLTADQLALDDLMHSVADTNGGEITDLDSVFTAWEREVGTGIEQKLFAIANISREKELRADALRDESKRLAEMAKSQEGQAKRLKEYAKFCMESMGIAKHKAGLFEARIQKNGGVGPLNIADEKWLRDREQFIKVTVELDNAAIREAVKAGTLPAEVASIGPTGTRLVFA